MNVLFLTLLDFSSIEENGIYTDLIKEFIKDGHSVWVISPSEKRKKEPMRILEDKNITILKPQIGNTQKTNPFRKSLSLFTLEPTIKKAISSFYNNIHFDLVLYSTPPINFARAISFVKERDNAESYLMLKDIFPQNAIDLEMIKANSLIHKYFRRKEKKLYSISDYIGCMSNANVNYLLKHNSSLDPKRVEVCPNSITPKPLTVNPQNAKQIYEKYKIPASKTIFVYGGNLGKPQGINFLLECLKENENNNDTFFVLAGAGTEFSKLKKYFTTAYPKNSILLPHLSSDEYEELLTICNVGLVFLDKRFTIPNFPSRILSYMQASLPILAASDTSSDLGPILEDNQFGLWVQSGELKAYMNCVETLSNTKLQEKMGKHARQYLENNYTSAHSYNIIMNHFDNKEDEN
jgi:glycosyltransferase involved in cell wall biosynthesis